MHTESKRGLRTERPLPHSTRGENHIETEIETLRKTDTHRHKYRQTYHQTHAQRQRKGGRPNWKSRVHSSSKHCRYPYQHHQNLRISTACRLKALPVLRHLPLSSTHLPLPSHLAKANSRPLASRGMEDEATTAQRGEVTRPGIHQTRGDILRLAPEPQL